MSLPLLNLDVVASLARLGRENIMIQKEERLRLLTELGAFDVAFGKEEEALRKSHYFFRTMDQVLEYGPTHKSRGEMKDAEIKAKGPFYDIPSTSSEKDPQNEANESTKTPPTTVYHINGHTIDAAKERDFFLQRGAIVSASMDERQNLPKSNHGTRFFDDGRPYTLCRISGCFSRNGGEKNQRLCQRHYTMIEGYTACDAIASKHTSKEAISDDTSVNSNASKTNYSCSYCDSQFDSYNEAVIHEKNCDCWSVQEATGIPGKRLLGSIFCNVFILPSVQLMKLAGIWYLVSPNKPVIKSSVDEGIDFRKSQRRGKSSCRRLSIQCLEACYGLQKEVIGEAKHQK